MRRVARLVGLGLAAAGLLAACQEKPQIMTGASRTPDSMPWQLANGANDAFRADGWKAAGDKSAWLKHLQERAQGQNDYSRR